MDFYDDPVDGGGAPAPAWTPNSVGFSAPDAGASFAGAAAGTLDTGDDVYRPADLGDFSNNFDGGVTAGETEWGDGVGGGSGGGGGPSGPMDPCAAFGVFIFGILCLIVASCLLFKNEGQYVQTMRAIEATRGQLVSLCDENCTRCDFNAVTHVASGKKRPLKSGDIIYASCGFYNFVPMSVIQSHQDSVGTAIPPELFPGLKPASIRASRAGVWEWDMSIYQTYYADKSIRSPDLRTSFGGKFATSPASVCSAREFKHQVYMTGQCTPTVEKVQWSVSGSQAYYSRRLSPDAVDNSSEMLEAPPGEVGEVAFASNQSVAPRFLAGAGSQAPSPPPPVYQNCNFEMCTPTSGWVSTPRPSANYWQRLPLAESLTVKSQLQAATNLPVLGKGRTDSGKVAFGAPLHGGGAPTQQLVTMPNSLSLGTLEKQASIFSAKAPAQLASLLPKNLFMRDSAPTITRYYLASKQPGGTPARVTVEEYARKDAASVWDVGTSRVGGACPPGCICGMKFVGQPSSGDLKICLSMSTTTSMSIIAGVYERALAGGHSASGPSWVLQEADVLKTNQGSLTKGQGFRVALNQQVPAQELFRTAEREAGSLQTTLRLLMPLVMWLGFFALLYPLLWLVDLIDQCVEFVPCIGSLAAGLVKCIGSLMAFMLCMVSCCAALSCSLLIIAVAWVFYRPLIGLSLLVVAFGILGALLYFGHTRQDKRDVCVRQQALQGVEMGSSFNNSHPQPQAPTAPPAASAGGVQYMQVTCPPAVGPGSAVQIQTADGRTLAVVVPPNVQPGQVFTVQV